MNKTKDMRANGVRYEMSILGGALRGLGLCMGTVAMERNELSISRHHDEEMAYIVECLGRYAERLSAELDVASVEAKK